MIKNMKNTKLQIKVQLKGFKPSIYKTFIMSENETFQMLHNYIQTTFWFFDYHLRNFRYWKYLEITKKDEYFEVYCEVTKSPIRTKLKDIFNEWWFSKLNYEYDYWDNWGFDVTCQKVIEDDKKYPTVLKSKWWMLIEDCGWVWWLEKMIELYNKKEFDEDLFDSRKEFEEYLKPYFDEIEPEDFWL